MKLSFPIPWLLLLAACASAPPAWAGPEAGDCRESDAIRLWLSPSRPEPGQSVKVMAVMTDGPAEDLVLARERGSSTRLRAVARGGPPWSLSAEIDLPITDAVRIEVQRGGETVACRLVDPGQNAAGGLAGDEREWSKPVEAFYSAWIEALFDAPAEENLAFKSLAPVLRDPDRNFLHGRLGQGEDARLPATPDCADLPYYLRAYFALKIGLPVAFRACDRGTGSRPPRCGSATIDDRFTRGPASAAAFSGLMRQIADTVHSGSARTGLADEATDFYPVPLDREVLWPGTVYADPYGHTLIIAQWRPPAAGRPGILFAVDAQPDNSVARKRFWEGNFLFADTAGAGPGFKAFRPLLRDAGRYRLPANTWLAVNAPVAPYSRQQDGLAPDDFYAQIGKAINPKGLAPEDAYDAMLDALIEQLETRVGAVDNGEDYVRAHRDGIIPMPTGAAIFETMGPWEDYATPSRDMRLLIALKVLARLPEQITRYPNLYALNGRSPAEAREAIEERHQRRIAEQRFSYTRSDGSRWELSVADVFARREALTLGYNPNDCVEIRWGAPAGSTEAETCNRRAPAEQKTRMAGYQNWFRNTQRPTR
ncbi:MAG: hypothetical protein ACKN9W_17580 [Methylococcus sp.]